MKMIQNNAILIKKNKWKKYRYKILIVIETHVDQSNRMKRKINKIKLIYV